MCALGFIVFLKSCVCCQALAAALNKNSALTELDSRGNNIGPEGAKAWCGFGVFPSLNGVFPSLGVFSSWNGVFPSGCFLFPTVFICVGFLSSYALGALACLTASLHPLCLLLLFWSWEMHWVSLPLLFCS